ncbi:MAG: hypothetical protein HY924_11300 [Elusimicrobia bacterium]|nr:hypothetical protein [Elusimicrobiota bacterium]
MERKTILMVVAIAAFTGAVCGCFGLLSSGPAKPSADPKGQCRIQGQDLQTLTKAECEKKGGEFLGP